MENNIFNKGEHVKEPGKYVCVPCGYKHEYKIGEVFTECVSCLKNEIDTEELEGTGMWEKQN